MSRYAKLSPNPCQYFPIQTVCYKANPSHKIHFDKSIKTNHPPIPKHIMKIWNTVTAVIFAFGTSVIADPGSIRNVDDGKVELEEGGFTVSLVLFDVPLMFLWCFFPYLISRHTPTRLRPSTPISCKVRMGRIGGGAKGTVTCVGVAAGTVLVILVIVAGTLCVLVVTARVIMAASANSTVNATVEGAQKASHVRTRYVSYCRFFCRTSLSNCTVTVAYGFNLHNCPSLQLNNGHGCLEDEDCKSGRCSKGLRCYDKVRANMLFLYFTSR